MEQVRQKVGAPVVFYHPFPSETEVMDDDWRMENQPIPAPNTITQISLETSSHSYKHHQTSSTMNYSQPSSTIISSLNLINIQHYSTLNLQKNYSHSLAIPYRYHRDPPPRYCSLRQRLVCRMFPDVSRIRLMNAEQEQVIRSGRAAAAEFTGRWRELERPTQKPGNSKMI